MVQSHCPMDKAIKNPAAVRSGTAQPMAMQSQFTKISGAQNKKKTLHLPVIIGIVIQFLFLGC